MTTQTISKKQFNLYPLLLALILMGIVALSSVESYVNERSHAVEKHGAFISNFARKCSADNKVNQIWHSFQRRTKAEICELSFLDDWADPNKEWSIRIIDSKTKEEMTVFSHTGDYFSLENYLYRQLYILFR